MGTLLTSKGRILINSNSGFSLSFSLPSPSCSYLFSWSFWGDRSLQEVRFATLPSLHLAVLVGYKVRRSANISQFSVSVFDATTLHWQCAFGYGIHRLIFWSCICQDTVIMNNDSGKYSKQSNTQLVRFGRLFLFVMNLSALMGFVNYLSLYIDSISIFDTRVCILCPWSNSLLFYTRNPNNSRIRYE